VRQAITYNNLQASMGNITPKKIFEIMRHHGEGYHQPALKPTATSACMLSPGEPLVAGGCVMSPMLIRMASLPGHCHFGTCVSIFKPVFLGMDLPDLAPIPTSASTRALWCGSTSYSTAGDGDFDHLVPEIRQDFDPLEEEFLLQAETVKEGYFW